MIRVEITDTGLDSDLGGLAATVGQWLLRVLSDDNIEGNCYLGEFYGGDRSYFGAVLNVLRPELMDLEPAAWEWLWNRLPILSSRRGVPNQTWALVDVILRDITGKATALLINKLMGTQLYQADVYGTFPPRHELPDWQRTSG